MVKDFKINLDDKFYITCDGLNWILNERKTKRAKRGNKWVNTKELSDNVGQTFYIRLNHLIRAFLSRSTKDFDVISMEEYVSRLEKLYQSVLENSDLSNVIKEGVIYYAKSSNKKSE